MSDVVLNDDFRPVPVGFFIDALDKFETNIIQITNILNNYVSKIKIEISDDEVSQCSMNFEFSASHDTYFSSAGMPPWAIFQNVKDDRVKYAIGYNFLVDDKYKVKVVSANITEINTGYEKAVKKYVGALKPIKDAQSRDAVTINDAQKNAVETAMKNLIKELRTLDDEIGKGETNYVDVALNKAYIFKGVPMTTTFNGGEDGVIKFDVSIHSSLKLNDLNRIDIAESTLTNTTGGSFKIASEAELLSFFYKSLTSVEIPKLSEFAALLFGYVKSGVSYVPGNYTILDNLSGIYTARHSAGVLQTRDSDILQKRQNFKTALDQSNNELFFNNLETVEFASYFMELKPSTLTQNLNAAAGTGGFTASIIKQNMDVAMRNAGVTRNQPATNQNYLTARTAFLNTVRSFITSTGSISGGDFDKYLNLVKSYFGITYKVEYSSESGVKNKIKFNEENASDTSNVPQLGSIENSVFLIEYGGAAVNFSHSIKAAGISIKDLKGSTSKQSVALSLDNSYSINMEISRDKIKQYAKKVYNIADADLEEYMTFIKKQIYEDPDKFLAQFVIFTLDVGNNGTSNVKVEGVGKRRGNQLLTVTLRNPIPGISNGSPIYFTTAGDEKQTSKDVSNVTDGKDFRAGFYILPNKVRGFYVVTKVTHVFNPKENIWSMTLECER